MEVVKEIRVSSRDKGCYVREKSSFHVNMSGLNLNINEKEKTFVQLEQLILPQKVRKIKFIMNFGFDKKYLKREDTREYEINYVSMNDLCNQINCLVYTNFIHNSVCVENNEAKGLPPKASSLEVEGENADGDAAEKESGNSAENPAENPAGNPAGESVVVINGPQSVVKNDNKTVDKVDGSTLLVNSALRSQMSGRKKVFREQELFCVEYVDGRIQIRIGKGFMFFASCNLMLALGYKSEVMRLFGGTGKNEVEVMNESDKLSLKLCSSNNIGDTVSFLEENDRICHIGFKKLIEPTFYVAGNLYSILCSYDVENKMIFCNKKRLSSTNVREVQFTLYNNAFEPYDIGVCLKSCPISFNLVISKKI